MNTTKYTPETETEMVSILFQHGFDCDSETLAQAGIVIGIDTVDTAFKRMCKLAVQHGIDIGEEA